MTLSVGSSAISDLYYGSTAVSKAYLGSTLVYERIDNSGHITLNSSSTSSILYINADAGTYTYKNSLDNKIYTWTLSSALTKFKLTSATTSGTWYAPVNSQWGTYTSQTYAEQGLMSVTTSTNAALVIKVVKSTKKPYWTVTELYTNYTK